MEFSRYLYEQNVVRNEKIVIFMVRKLTVMKLFVWIIVPLAILSNLSSCDRPRVNISVVTPQPQQIVATEGSFTIADTIGVYTNMTSRSMSRLDEWLAMMPSGRSCSQSEAQLSLIIDSIGNQLPNEAYRLTISRSGITIQASTEAGLFYGVQTLSQLYCEYGSKLPYVSIEDTPRFTHRAFLLDCSSRILSVEFIKRQLDMMAHYKLNNFYWDIAGEEVWRLKSENSAMPSATDAAGYYTREQMREVIDYAAKRYINVVPTINVPWQRAGLALAEQILPEIIAIFPSELIYIGDTATDNTTIPKCKTCRRPIKDSRLNSKEAEAIGRIEHLLRSRGRRLATSQDGLQYGLTTGSVIVSNGDMKDVRAILEQGYSVVTAPNSFSALDCYQNYPLSEPEAMPGMLPLEKVYNFNPYIDSSALVGAGSLLGVCANMRTGLTADDRSVEYMIYPRLLAAAEVAWSRPERKSSVDFRKRAHKAVRFLREHGYNTFDLETENITRAEAMETVPNLAAGKKVYYHILHDDQYSASGKSALVDGERGGWAYDDGRWQGFQGTGINLTIDLENAVEIKSIVATFMHDHIARILPPREIDISYSCDGETFISLKHIDNGPRKYFDIKVFSLVDFGWQGDIVARYIRYVTKPHGGLREWTFADEIVVM